METRANKGNPHACVSLAYRKYIRRDIRNTKPKNTILKLKSHICNFEFQKHNSHFASVILGIYYTHLQTQYLIPSILSTRTQIVLASSCQLGYRQV